MTKRIEIEVTDAMAALIADAARATRLGQKAVVIAALEAYLDGFKDYRQSLLAIEAVSSDLLNLTAADFFESTFRLVHGDAPVHPHAAAGASPLHLQNDGKRRRAPAKKAALKKPGAPKKRR